jgi:Glycine-zipper domain
VRALGLPIAAAVLLTACATIPQGPSVMVLPGGAKSFDQFQTDDGVCRQWALQQVGVTNAKAATDTAVGGAVIGTAVGAAIGAAIGAAAGNPAAGAAIGAGVGLTGGSIGGAAAAEGARNAVQRRYDIAYMQCMYAKGNRIPVPRGSQPSYATQPRATTAPPPRATAAPPPPPSVTIPPPPAGEPPPPPPAR